MKLILLFCLVTNFLNECLSASLLSMQGGLDIDGVFVELYSKGIHIPSLLAANKELRNKICDDIVTGRNFRNAGFLPNDGIGSILRFGMVADENRYFDDINTLQATCPVSVHQIKVQVDSSENQISIPETMMECLAVRSDDNRYSLHNFFVSSAPFYNTFFAGFEFDDGVKLQAMAELSPEYVEFTQEQLEQYYLSMRLPVERIRKRHPDVAWLMDTQDHFSVLSETECLRLCISVLESDYYQAQSVIFKGYQRPASTEDKYVKRQLSFETPNTEGLVTENIVCEGEKDGVIEPFFITRSYNDENSLFVQRLLGDALYLDVYMKKVPILINSAYRPSFSPIEFLKKLDVFNFLNAMGINVIV